MPSARVVLDTNVLLSALLFHAGSVSWLRSAWQAEAICPLVSHGTAAELIRVLSYPKFRLSTEEQEDLLADYLPWCETVVCSKTMNIPDCREPPTHSLPETRICSCWQAAFPYRF